VTCPNFRRASTYATSTLRGRWSHVNCGQVCWSRGHWCRNVITTWPYVFSTSTTVRRLFVLVHCVGVLHPVVVCSAGDGEVSGCSSTSQPATVDQQHADPSEPPAHVRMAGVGNKTGEPDPFTEMTSALSPDLDANQCRVTECFLRRYEDTFSKNDCDLGLTDLVMHRIDRVSTDHCVNRYDVTRCPSYPSSTSMLSTCFVKESWNRWPVHGRRMSFWFVEKIASTDSALIVVA